MECKYCGAQLEDEQMVCPYCGEVVVKKEGDVIAEEYSDLPEDHIFEEEKTEKKKAKWWMIAFAVVGCVALLGALAVVILQGMGISLKPRENNISYKDTYYVTDKKAIKKADNVVAEIADRKLTNSELQIFYWMQVDEFVGYYGTSYFDYTKPLNEQLVSEQSGLTWQQYFVEMAINMWQRYQLLTIFADEAGYESVQEYRDSLSQIAGDLEEVAKENKFDSADAMIQNDMGAACSVADYLYYIELRNVSALFLSDKYVEAEPDEKTVEEYFAEHEAELKSSGVTKESGSLVDVRHILIQLDEPKADAYGKVTYTDEQWEECRKKAQDILDSWKSGKATEETFAELANANSKDGGSNTTGGLYQQVKKGTMVEAFDKWIFDESRECGDTGLVKTEFGYHIMYFVTSEEIWVTASKTGYLSDMVDDMIAEGEKNYPMTVNYKNIALTDIYG